MAVPVGRYFLFHRLFVGELAAKLSRQRRVPAYAIFSDRSLIDMATRLPLTKWDFGEVHGVGSAKLEQFAVVFLAEISAFVAETAQLRKNAQGA